MFKIQTRFDMSLVRIKISMLRIKEEIKISVGNRFVEYNLLGIGQEYVSENTFPRFLEGPECPQLLHRRPCVLKGR